MNKSNTFVIVAMISGFFRPVCHVRVSVVIGLVSRLFLVSWFASMQVFNVVFFCWFTGVNIASQPVSQSQVPVPQQQATPTPVQATPPQTTPQHAQLFVQQQNTAFFIAQQQVTATLTILEILFNIYIYRESQYEIRFDHFGGAPIMDF